MEKMRWLLSFGAPDVISLDGLLGIFGYERFCFS